MLSVESLDVAYGDFQVLWDVSLRVEAGEIVALLGPNGAGKSTLLNAVSGLVPSRRGHIELGGRCLDGLPAHRRVGEGLAIARPGALHSGPAGEAPPRGRGGRLGDAYGR